MNLLAVAKRSPLVLPLACVAALAIMFLSEHSYWRASTTLDDMAAIAKLKVTTGLLLVGMLDAETGQRGYLLTADKAYLEPYVQGLKDSEAAMGVLSLEYGGDQYFSTLLAHINELQLAKKQVLAQALAWADEGRREQALALVKSGVGKAQMDKLRADIAELLQLETERFDRQRERLNLILTVSRIGLAALCASSLLALFLYLRQTLILKQQTLESRRTLQDDRDQLQDEAGLSTLMLTELTQHLLTAREDERGRLARDLHDELGALLTSAKLDAARIKSRLVNLVPGAPEALERLAHLVGTLNASIALGRTIIEDLRPSTLSNLGLLPTLEILVREFAEAKGLQVHCELQPVELASGAEIIVYRVVQEAVTNISKYAQARQIWLKMQQVDGVVTVSVRDDGVGFDSEVVPRSTYGLLGMRMRVEAEGGQLQVSSNPGQGTLIQISLPACSANLA
ncbi:CHASE3 domain-containing protein [Roseateles sp.]|uniref:CHASE3 domain-containing protein n=1 Tax=Roseateles sp. TaxID=1971397 RepID=UPI00286D2146|nr:CHASE3 domain-containing protein [Roseateles sp.]